MRWRAGRGIVSTIGLLLLGLLLYGVLEPAPTASQRPPTSPASVKSPLGPGTGRHVASLPQGSLRITGTVRSEDGPAAGVRVSASRAEPGETLSELPCPATETDVPSRPSEQWMDCGPRAQFEVQERVAAREGEARVLAETTTREDGTFELDGLDDGPVALWAMGAHGAALRHDVAAGSQGVVLPLEEGRVFTGVVKALSDMTAITDARITVFSHQHTRFFDARTDTEGRFRIGPLPTTSYAVLITGEGWTSLFFARASALEYEPLWLSQPVRVTGQVVSAQGAPAPGVEVMMTMELPTLEQRFTTTDAAGRFTFESAHPIHYELAAWTSARDAVATLQGIAGATPAQPVLRLEPMVFLTGTIRDDLGKSVAGARITGRRTSEVGLPGKDPVAVTGADGRYRLGPLVPGPHEVRVEAAHHIDLRGEAHSIDARPEPLDFTLLRAMSVEGVLVDADGQPLVGRRVALRQGRSIGLGLDATVITDEEGRFVLDTRTEGSGTLIVDEEDLVFEQLAVTIPARDVRLVVRRGGSVSGTVLSTQGVPMTSVTVVLHGTGNTSDSFRAGRTDRRGRFTLEGMPAGHYMVESSVQTDALELATTAPVEVTEGKTAEVSLRFAAGRTLTGLAVDSEGNPVEGVAVRAYVPSEDIPSWRRTLMGCGMGTPDGILSDKEGRFTLRHLNDPRYELSVSRRDYTFEPQSSQGGTVVKQSLRIDAGTSALRLVLKRRPQVRGRVVDDGGRPFTNFSVNNSLIDSTDGTFTRALPSPPPRSLVVSALDFAPLELPLPTGVEQGDVDLGDIKLSRGRTVKGILRQLETGTPLEGEHRERVVIRIQGGTPLGDLTVRHEVISPDGTVLIPGIPAQPVTIQLAVPGYLPSSQPVAPEARTFTADLDPGAIVDLQARTATGQPFPGSFIFTAEDGMTYRHPAPTGVLRVRGLPPGRYTVQPTARDVAQTEHFQAQSLSVPPRGQVSLTFKALDRGGTLTLRTDDIGRLLVIPGTHPFPDGEGDLTRLTRLSHPDEWVEDLPGILRIHHLPAGHYTLFAMSKEGTSLHRQELDMPATGEPSLDLRPVWRPFPAR